jgi:hypothetical protein
MRVVSGLLYTLAGLATVIWGWGYYWVSGMACSFVTTGGCRVPMPWSLRGEDLQVLVLIPGGVVAVLLMAAVLTGRRAARSRSTTAR